MWQCGMMICGHLSFDVFKQSQARRGGHGGLHRSYACAGFREEVPQDVDDIKRQFPETSSGVKALHNLHGFKARTVLRKVVHAVLFVVQTNMVMCPYSCDGARVLTTKTGMSRET